MRAGAVAVLLLGWALCAGAARGGTATILVLGDSLSAGHGIDVDQGWVHLLAQRIARRGLGYRVVNASISGDTTAGGLARLPRAIDSHHPAVTIVELGGNDGLRGLPPGQTQSNLAAIVTMLKRHGSKVLLVGIRMPPNYGRQYTERFDAIYPELARRFGVPLVPFLLTGIADHPELMQRDDIHPRAAGQERMLDNVWPYLEPLL